MNTPVELVQPYPDNFTKSAKGGGIVVLDSGGQETLHGHTRTLVASASVGAVGSNLFDEGWYGNATVSYTAEMVVFTLQGRPKLDHDPSNMYQDLEFNPGNYDVSNLAAGGLNTPDNVHQGDVIMGVKRNYDLPLGGVKRSQLPHLKISRKEGYKIAAKITNEKTTTDGQGRLLAGVFTSRDLTTRGWVDPPGISLSNTASSTRVPFFTGEWANVEWKMGENGEKPWDELFFSFDADYSETVFAKAKTVGDKPLTGHTMKFIVRRLGITKSSSVTGGSRRILYTTDAQEAASPSSQYSGYKVIYQKQIAGAPYVEFDPATATDQQDGVYKTKMTIKHSDDFQVTDLSLALEDQGVYLK